MNKIQRILNAIGDSRMGRRLVILGFFSTMLGLFLYVSVVKDYFFPPEALYVYTFVDMFHPEGVAAFEQANKVKVVLRYFESNEELLAKFNISRGAGYDVVMVSDYMVEFLRKDNLLQKMQYDQLPVAQELDPRLKNKFYDPNNNYSLPFSWIPYGVIFNKNLFDSVPEQIGLHVLFSDPIERSHGIKMSYRICMPDDSREAIFLAGQYLFGVENTFTKNQLVAIQALLIKQKSWVESYVNQDLGYPLFSGLIKASFAPLFAVDKVLKTSENFLFRIPSEGSMLSIENLAIPASCKKVQLAHKFINFMLSKNEAARISNLYGMIPSNKAAYQLLRPEMTKNNHVFPDDEQFAKLHLLTNDVPQKAFEEIWLAVKSS